MLTEEGSNRLKLARHPFTLRCLLALLLISFILPARAQSEGGEPIYLSFSGDETLKNAVQGELASLGIVLDFKPYTARSAFSLRVLASEFRISPIYPAVAAPSPLISLAYSGGVGNNSFDRIRFARRDTVTDEQFQQLSVNTFVSLILYRIDRCDLALSYFETAVDQAESYTHRTTDMLYTGDVLAFLRFYQANCYLLMGDYEHAALSFEHSLALDTRPKPRNAGTFRSRVTGANLAWTYLQLGDPEKAFTLLAGLLEEHPFAEDQAQILATRAHLHALTFDYDSAIADMDAAISLDSHNPALYVLRGQMIILLYEWDRVLMDYNTALELDPDYAAAYYFRGILYYTQQSLDRLQALELAQADFEAYLALAPDGDHAAAARQTLGDIAAQLNALTAP